MKTKINIIQLAQSKIIKFILTGNSQINTFNKNLTSSQQTQNKRTGFDPNLIAVEFGRKLLSDGIYFLNQAYLC